MRWTQKINLDGPWNLTNEDGDISMPAMVPGSVYEALIENVIIEDPFYGENEHQMAWVFDSSWMFETTTVIPAEFLEHECVVMRCHGIDSIAEIKVNGARIGAVENAFMRHEFDVKANLVQGENHFCITIKSPTAAARDKIKQFKVKLRMLGALAGGPYLRKPQFSFGWDWGPQLPDLSIWQPVELIAHDGTMIASVFPILSLVYNKDPLAISDPLELSDIMIPSASMRVNVELARTSNDFDASTLTINVVLHAPDGRTFESVMPVREGTQASIDLEIPDPVLWWTHDLGQPALHELVVTLLDNDEPVDVVTQKVGIRDIQLVRRPDTWGETFYFMLNGTPVFAKGANWIPVDSFMPRGKRLGLYKMLLDDAKEANMNFLRVWGGGVYEDDLFYDLCDELGILAWQDFPFACAVYPPSKEFIDAVRPEAIQNIKRLRHHASLALWCGNNEIEQLWPLSLIQAITWKFWLAPRFKRGYIELFERMLPALVKELDPTRNYWPSSPSNGGGDKKRGPLSSNDPTRGDSHFWKVWHMGAPFTEYRKFDSRFMSEFGFESFPSMRTIETFCPPEQWSFESPIMKNHQKNMAGNGKIMAYMKRRFAIPSDFRKQVILSQITQAEAMEYGVEHWRRNRNQQHCMGSLYWQLNDCWPVASWSSIDYFGRWKALQYYAKRFYAPIVASAREDKTNVDLWVTNDARDSRQAVLSWTVLHHDGSVLLSGSQDVDVPPCSSIKAITIDTASVNKTEVSANSNILFYSITTSSEGQVTVQHGFRLFGNPKDFPLHDPGISWTMERAGETRAGDPVYTFQLASREIALFVHVESDKCDFIASDNFFAMAPGEGRQVSLRIVHLPSVPGAIETGELDQTAFHVNSLYDLL
ncbi:MAG TPA: glycoside hydrolase family 2 protein [Candidatus Lokiarchaeia archaeon]|nr:glycoside hydrolase family 2 protein [Candidatus Lokiarchaeia archaeon]